MGSAQHKLSPAGWARLVVGGGLAFYWMHTYTGPFEWFAELQLRWMGRYIDKLTFALTFLVTYGALVLVYLPVRWGLRAGAGGSAEVAGGGRRDLSRVAAYFVASLVGLGFVVAGAIQYEVSVARLERGEAPASRWVRVSGYPVAEAALWMETSLGKSY